MPEITSQMQAAKRRMKAGQVAVWVQSTRMPTPTPMFGKPPATVEDALTAARTSLKTGNFSHAWIITTNGIAEVRL